MKRLQRFESPVVVVYLWTIMIVLGAVVLETFMVYPNIFHDPPRSLELAMEFMAVRAPNDFFPPLGFLSWVAGVGAVVVSWRVGPARRWMLLSLLMIIADGLFSMVFLWPRNEIMFVEGSAIHSAEALRRTAEEFQTLHWARLAFNAASAVFAFVGFVTFDRRRTLAQSSRQTERPSAQPVSPDHAAAVLGGRSGASLTAPHWSQPSFASIMSGR